MNTSISSDTIANLKSGDTFLYKAGTGDSNKAAYITINKVPSGEDFVWVRIERVIRNSVKSRIRPKQVVRAAFTELFEDDLADVVSQIVWFPQEAFTDQTLQRQSEDVTVLLCHLGEITSWYEGPHGIHIPDHFLIEDIEVEFLPTGRKWYSVGGIVLPLPSSFEQVQIAVSAVASLKRMGYPFDPFGSEA